ncbi:hypothetical protein Bca52824_037343 [Brassica carinata]|uniref:Protease Do-like 14 n=1 Tax=Brassica carinata TaxID=52824 RepID=A0A8X7V4Q4_BRACI|nr:hypothetical protein Bca52824_037343 [Brassica carinata]
MFLRRFLKTTQISSYVGTIRTISSSLHTTPSTTSSPALKRKIFANLKSSENPCDDVLRDMEEQGFQINPADLTRWANLLEKQGREEKALEILSFLDWKCCLMMSKSALCVAGNRYTIRTFRRVAKIISPSVVNIDGPNESYGSGIVFGEEGKIITCAHIVVNLHKFRASPVYRSKRIEVEVALSCDQTFRGVVADCDADYDLALVKIETPTKASFSPAKFGVSNDVSVGDMVLSIDFANSFSTGIISCVKRTNKEIDVKGKCQFYLQTECPLNEGYFGGPVVNLEGEVIGVNCAYGKRNVRDGFAMPIDTVMKVMKERNW